MFKESSRVVAAGFGMDHRRFKDAVDRVSRLFDVHVNKYTERGESGRPSDVYEITDEILIYLPSVLKGSEGNAAFYKQIIGTILQKRSGGVSTMLQMKKSEIFAIAAEQARLLETQEAALITADAAVKSAEKRIQELEPAADLGRLVSSGEATYTLEDAAHQLNTGQNRLAKWLREHGYFKRETTRPYQVWINQGLFQRKIYTYRRREGEPLSTGTRTYITGKGLERIASHMQDSRQEALQ